MGNVLRRQDCTHYIASRPRKIQVIKAIQLKNIKGIVHKSDLSLRIFDVSPRQHSWSLLHYAVWLREPQVATELLEIGADLEVRDVVRSSKHNETARSLATRLKHYDVLEAIEQFDEKARNRDPNICNETQIFSWPHKA